MGTVRSLIHLMQYDRLLEIPPLNSAVLPVDYCEEAFFLSCIVYLIKNNVSLSKVLMLKKYKKVLHNEGL